MNHIAKRIVEKEWNEGRPPWEHAPKSWRYLETFASGIVSQEFAVTCSRKSMKVLLDEVRAILERKQKELTNLCRLDKKLELHMQKIRRVPYDLGYADAAGKGRIRELELVGYLLRALDLVERDNIGYERATEEIITK